MNERESERERERERESPWKSLNQSKLKRLEEYSFPDDHFLPKEEVERERERERERQAIHSQ